MGVGSELVQALLLGRTEIIGLMKKILFLCLLLFAGTLAKADQKPYIISGFDDVLRQAENTGLIKASLKILGNDKGFSGMPEIEFGKPLQYSLKGLRRLRVGDYRMIFKIEEDDKIVFVVKIGHRREVYES